MKLRTLITSAALALLPLCASAATLVIPASGTGPGVNGSRWQTELTLHNASARAIHLSLAFHDAFGRASAVAVDLDPRATKSLSDVVATLLGRESATGALVIEATEADLRKLAVGSRTFNRSATGEFGQDIPAVNLADAAGEGDVSVLATPSSAIDFRYNFGLFAASDATVRWELIRANGTVATVKIVNYAAGTQTQHNAGVSSLLGATPQNSDTIHAVVTKGTAIFYGSAIHQGTGDPTFVPSVITHPDIRIQFAGIDLDENGTVDVADADGDGVLDQALDLHTSSFPNYFRVVAAGETGEKPSFQIVSTPGDALLIDDNGTVMMAAGADLKNKTGELRIRATSDTTSAVLVIPVSFR